MRTQQVSLRLRAARAEDAPMLSEIARTSKAHWHYSAAQIAAWQDDLLVTPTLLATGHARIAEIAQRAAGFFLIEPPAPGDDASEWALSHLWVLPEHMGRGIGRTLMAAARELAAAQGARTLRIDADPNAEAFYLASGAQRVGAVDAPIEGQPARQRPQMRLALA